MKKQTVFLAILSIICLSLCFVACDDVKDNCTVTFVTSGIGVVERYEKTIVKGDVIRFEDFNEAREKSTQIGCFVYTGLYLDSSCVFKRDDSTPIFCDTTVYVKKSAEGTPVVNFVLDGENHFLAVEKSKTVGVFDFIASAYGKSAIPEQFDFFKDEQCTEKLILNGYSYKTCSFDFWQRCNIYVKKHDVANVEFCIHNGGESCSTFLALVRTDEPLGTNTLQMIYNAYFGEGVVSVQNAVFYSDEELEDEISVVGELRKIHASVSK